MLLLLFQSVLRLDYQLLFREISPHSLPHPPAPTLKELFGEDQRLDLKDGRNCTQYVQFIVGLVSFIINSKGMLFEKRVNRLAGVVHLLWGEGTVTGLQ